MLTVAQLAAEIKSGAVDTVVAAFTDMQGRLLGKRLDGHYFMATAAKGEPVEGCNHLLSLHLQLLRCPGLELARSARGVPDVDPVPPYSLRRPPHPLRLVVL